MSPWPLRMLQDTTPATDPSLQCDEEIGTKRHDLIPASSIGLYCHQSELLLTRLLPIHSFGLEHMHTNSGAEWWRRVT
eukprot:15462009-Alexandrium_andersonii.AAC.1